MSYYILLKFKNSYQLHEKKNHFNNQLHKAVEIDKILTSLLFIHFI